MEHHHYLIGTAGHVDHGKTELIRALTGTDTDRLKEEKQRGISIELGFAALTLPSGRNVDIIDVPGHERFVRQMLAGATGMDGVLLVIAADEGIMPQTREHLDILTLLGVTRGIVVINKIDLVDEEWLELIQEEIREGLADTFFAQAPVYLVSAHTGTGISELKKGMDDLLTDAESKVASGPIRLPLDRVFSVQGFGTVVTGTLHNGTMQLGQEVAIEPSHLISKVRSLQVHNRKSERAFAGQRVAVNLAGVDVDEVKKGAVLITPGAYPVGNIIDLKLRNLASMEKPIAQRQRVRFHIGTVEVLGRIHLLEQEELLPGQEGYAQILLEKPVVATAGDRFVIRFYSPAFTIGGGKVLGVAELKRKRFKESVLAQLRIKDQGDPFLLLERELQEPRTVQELMGSLHWESADIEKGLHQLADSGRLVIWKEESRSVYWKQSSAEVWLNQVHNLVQAYEQEFPLRGGMSREELKVKLGIKWPQRRWQTVLEQGAEQEYYRLKGSKVRTFQPVLLPAALEQNLSCLKNRWQTAGLMPPELEAGAAECRMDKGEPLEYAAYLVDQGDWVAIAGLYFDLQRVQQAQNDLVALLEKQQEVAVSDVRELWGISRKYAVPLLEYFDQQKVTKRQGDKRILNR